MVDKEKSKQPHGTLELSCCAQCLNSISLVSQPLPQSAKWARDGGNGEMGEWGSKGTHGEEAPKFRAASLKAIELGSVQVRGSQAGSRRSELFGQT